MTSLTLKLVRALAKRRIVIDTLRTDDEGTFDVIKYHKDGKEREIGVWRGPVTDEDAFLRKLLEEVTNDE